MAKSQCSYHVSKASVWHCFDCEKNFCGECVVSIQPRIGAANLPLCALCGSPLDYLGGGNEAKPFWSMAHVFFAFPFRGSGIAALGFIAFIGLFFSFGLMGLAAGLFAAAVILKYGLTTLEAVADGQDSPPSINDAIQGDEDNLFLKFVAIMLIIGFSTIVVTVLVGEIAGTAFSMLVSLLAPAMFVYLAIDRQVSSALNPMKLIGLAMTIGPPYLLVVLLSNVISTGPVFVMSMIGESIANSMFAGPLTAALLGYFAIVYFALLGYVLYENQSELGYVAGDASDQAVAETLVNKRRQVLGEANVLFKENRDTDAFAKLAEVDEALRGDSVFAERYFSLASEKRHEHAVGVAADLQIAQLFSKEAYDLALDVWRKAREINAAYLPAAPQWRHKLADAAQQRNLTKEAFVLLVNLHKDHEGYEELPSAYLALARLLEQQGKAGDARKILNYLEQRKLRRFDKPATRPGDREAPQPQGNNSDPGSWTLQD